MSRYSGRPELKPVKTQISIRRLNSAWRQPIAGAVIGGIVAVKTASLFTASLEPINGQRSEQVGQDAHPLRVVQHDPLEDAKGTRRAVCIEVGHGAKVDVGRVVPLIGQV